MRVNVKWEGEWEGARQVPLELTGILHPKWPEQKRVRIMAHTQDGDHYVQLLEKTIPPPPGDNKEYARSQMGDLP